LEERTRPAQKRPRSEEERFTDWQADAAITRRDATPKCAFHARSMIRWLAMIGKLPANAEALIERIMAEPHDVSGYRQPPETRSRSVVTWEVMRSVWREEEGMEPVELSSEWYEAFEAGEELRRLFGAIPPETVALWIVERRRQRERGATDEELKHLDASCLVPHGITEELEERAVGPDADEVSDAEKKWRISEHVHDVFASSWGFQMHKHASRLEN
jgi:hypothetical protein